MDKTQLIMTQLKNGGYTWITADGIESVDIGDNNLTLVMKSGTRHELPGSWELPAVANKYGFELKTF